MTGWTPGGAHEIKYDRVGRSRRSEQPGHRMRRSGQRQSASAAPSLAAKQATHGIILNPSGSHSVNILILF